MPFPRYEDSTWATQLQAPGVRIRMPLPASCYVNPPAPWVWPGQGSVVAVTRVRGPQPPTSTTSLSGLPGPAALPLGPSDVGPTAVPPPSTPSMFLKNTSPPPRAFVDFLRASRPLLSRWRHRLVWTLLPLRRCHKTLRPFHKDLLQRWWKDGRMSCYRTWRATGNSS